MQIKSKKFQNFWNKIVHNYMGNARQTIWETPVNWAFLVFFCLFFFNLFIFLLVWHEIYRRFLFFFNKLINWCVFCGKALSIFTFFVDNFFRDMGNARRNIWETFPETYGKRPSITTPLCLVLILIINYLESTILLLIFIYPFILVLTM